MKKITIKSALMRLVAVVLLTLGTVSASAQNYQMVVHTDDGLAYPFNANRIDSVSFVLTSTDDGGNDEDETTVTGNATDITNNTANITSWANILDNLSSDLKVGIIYTQEGTPSKSNGTQKTVSTSSLGSDAKYTIQLTDLAPSTTYYYRSFVYQSGIWFYGNVKSFTTKGQGVELVSGEVTKLTCYSAKISGAVSIDESTQYRTLTYGICYSTGSTPTVNSTRLQASSKDQDGNFTVQLRALTGSTTYYYRSYAYVDSYLSYGPIRSFTTKDDDVVITGDIDTLTYTVKSTIKIGSGAYSTLELGVCYGTNASPTVNNWKVTTNEVDDENNFTLTLKDIPFGTVYYRSFVKIDGVAHYGDVKEFAGNEITTGDIDSTYSIQSHIMLNQSFYTKTMTYGICYGTNATPTVSDKTVTTNEVDDENNYTISLKDIPFGKVYYYRSFVKIDGVAHYGDVKEFAGNEITTGDIDSTYSIQSHIKLNQSFYTKTVTYGICYGTNATPTVSDKTVTTNEVDDENNFTLSLKDIPFDTVYYRSFVKIDGVAHYGNTKVFSGNEITTGDIDSTYNVKSHIKLNQSFYTKTVTYGICYGINSSPTVNDQIVTTNEVDDENNFILTLKDIPFGTTVYYRSFVKIDGVAHYGEFKNIYLPMPIGEAVDLGLSVKWATFNVGASKPEEYGCYYAWGETEPKTDYSWSTYKYCNGSYSTMTKYCNDSSYGNNGFTDTKTTLDPDDDVAHVKWGGDWRMPTKDEFTELLNNCTWTWITLNGVKGYRVTSNKSGYTDRSIFLPTAGYRGGTYLSSVGSGGHYWSSSLYTGNPSNAWHVYFNSGGHDTGGRSRYSGLSVRPVCP